MNIFRILGDAAHLVSILILIHKIHLSKSCRGISFKTQLLYFLVFAMRYSNLFSTSDKWSWLFTLYLFLMRVFFLGSSAYVLYLMRIRFKPTHDPAIDTIRLEYLLGPAFALGVLTHYRDSPSGTLYEILWATSIYLEAVAILPQLFMLQRTGEAETITTHYLFALGLYRALYIPNWIWRLATEKFWDPISIVSGLVQTGLYLDFFYVYFTKVMQGQKFELPA
ncbi:endoplasmic reticulum retention protein [Tilletia horrida]|nr:endoplasmic reticulum retention protein [Tilletia horrida]